MTENLMRQAEKNLDAALATSGVFPENVFRGRWDAFFFFDPDLLFAPESAETLKALLSCENGAVLCVRNLDITHTEGTADVTVFPEKETLGETYWALLCGTSIGRSKRGQLRSAQKVARLSHRA
jgi:hypothetical protein